ncbi:GNAT family N-acetyltransferase [Nocardia takedensis]|uniref:GNAT family N-acetyltransferase n=1 Tax=Nocardia takedensis TaxID=259390 RepID=UPI00068614E6|nr:GNAT family N-acetyltransferase [Nocardia takedensis]
MAENAAGEIVGDLWIGPGPREATGTERSAWLYDIYVFEPFRRRGYGSAALAAAERLIGEDGVTGRVALPGHILDVVEFGAEDTKCCSS